MTLRCLLIASAAILSAVAQQTPPDEQVDPKKVATIEGPALNSHTGESLNKVNSMNAGAMLASQTVYLANLDASGKFKIERIEPGSYTLAAERFGCVRNTYNPRQGSVMGATINLSAGQYMKELNLKMLPQAVVSGHIVDEDGDPVLDARIQIMRCRELVAVSAGMTNDLGEYRVHSIPPGRYYVAAMPGSTDESAARQIELTAGQSLPGLDVKIKKSVVLHVKGKIAGVPPPLKNLRLNLKQRGIAFTAPRPNASMDRYRVALNGLPERLCLKAATTGGRDVLENGLDLGSGPVEPLEIVLVKPGTYKIYAWEASDLSTNNEPEFLKKYSTDAKQIEIKPNGAENLSLKPIPPAN